MDKRTYRPGDTVKVPGIYTGAGGHRVALSIGEAFPPGRTKGTGWTLMQRISVERNPALIQAARPTANPVIIDVQAMDYAIARSFDGGWNLALTTLEAKLLAANGKGDPLGLIAELRIRRATMPETTEGDPE